MMKKIDEEIVFLTEYGEPHTLSWSQQSTLEFEAFLEEVWENRTRSGILSDWYEAEEEPVNQGLLQIKHKRIGKEKLQFEVRASNYIGIIRFNNTTFHILPKIFHSNSDNEGLKKSNAHLLWWLSYSKRLALPKHISSLSHRSANFLEILIHLFAANTRNELKKGVYQTYQEIDDETSYLKGQLVFNEYISNYLGRANYQKMYCRYDSFEIDNQFNRIVKYVSKWLRSKTQLKESRLLLDDIIWMLDEVSDVHISHTHCDAVVLNSMFSDYQMILDYCRMFLLNGQSTSSDSSADAFAFLVPMETVFEDFVLGFIDKEISQIEVSGKYKGKKLTEAGDVALKPDLHLHNLQTNQRFLADTKYKLIHEGFKGISRSDLYQMAAYAIRYKADQIHLFYPHWSAITETSKQLQIRDEFASEDSLIKIDLHTLEVTANDFDIGDKRPVDQIFQPTADNLKKMIVEICSGD